MTQPRLIIVAAMVARPANVDAVRALVTPAVDAFRAEPGRSGYVLLEGRRAPGRFVTYETWADEDVHEVACNGSAQPSADTAAQWRDQQDFLSILVEL